MKLYLTHTLWIIWVSYLIISNVLKSPQSGIDMAFHRIFPFYGNFYIHKHLLKFCEAAKTTGNLCFLLLFPYYVNSLYPYFGNCMIFVSAKIFEKSITLECQFFPNTFPVLQEFHFLMFWELYAFLLHPKYFKKPINLKCLCFPILFPYQGNPLFPCVGNCMNFCFKQKIPETLNFGMFVFSHIFPLLCKFTFSIFWDLYGFLVHPKYLRNPLLWNVCFFPILFPYYGNSLSHVLDIAWISASSEIFKKPINLNCSCFPILFHVMEIRFSHVLGTTSISASS